MDLEKYLLWLSAPIIALVFLLLWVALVCKRASVMNVKLTFLGLTLSVRSCQATEAECLAFQRHQEQHKGN